mmetsp:Transcript_7787/g.20120  ORF Transcript_7787/g.20120 Transcript_7787/m.20120 type:complete len:156 (+) Transcript_7787:438-905(+)
MASFLVFKVMAAFLLLVCTHGRLTLGLQETKTGRISETNLGDGPGLAVPADGDEPGTDHVGSAVDTLWKGASEIVQKAVQCAETEFEDAKNGRTSAIAALSALAVGTALLAAVVILTVHRLQARRRRARYLAQWSDFDTQVMVTASPARAPLDMA